MKGRPWSGPVQSTVPPMGTASRLTLAAAGWGLSVVWHVTEVRRKAAAGDLTDQDLRHHMDHAARHARYAWREANRRLALDGGRL